MHHPVLDGPEQELRLHRHGVVEIGPPDTLAERERSRCAEDHDRHDRRCDCSPAPGQHQHERDQKPELRLDGEQPEQQARKDRASIELEKPADEQRRDQEATWPHQMLTIVAGARVSSRR